MAATAYGSISEKSAAGGRQQLTMAAAWRQHEKHQARENSGKQHQRSGK